MNEINKQSDRYNYGYIRNHSRIQKEKILLPVKENDEMDFVYMENYIKKMTLNQLNNYIKYKQS